MPRIEHLSPPQAVSMTDNYDRLASTDHFWLSWRASTVFKNIDLLPQTPVKVLEIGCGTGIFLQQLEQNSTWEVHGCDLRLEALELCATTRSKLFLYNIHDRNPRFSDIFQVVFLMDVLEHVDDDVAFLCSAAYHLVPQGLLVISVPCHQFLFSKYDLAAGHKRRYSRTSILKCIRASGLTPLRLGFYGASMIPVLLARKFAVEFMPLEKVYDLGFDPPGRLAACALSALKRMECASPLNIPCGASAVVFARKE